MWYSGDSVYEDFFGRVIEEFKGLSLERIGGWF